MIPDLATHSESSEWSCIRARHHSLHLVHIVVVQNSLHGRGTEKDCVLKLWRQGDPQDFVASSQDKPFQEGMKDVGPIAHQADIRGSAVHALAVGDGPLKEIGKLSFRAEVVGSDKVHHAPILCEVVLKRVACHQDATPCSDLLQSLGDVCDVILNPVSLITDHQVWPGTTQCLLDLWWGREGERKGREIKITL